MAKIINTKADIDKARKTHSTALWFRSIDREWLADNQDEILKLIRFAKSYEMNHDDPYAHYKLWEIVKEPPFNDNEDITEALIRAGMAVPESLSERIRRNRNLVLLAAKSGYNILHYAPDFRDDKDIVIESVKHGYHLHDVSERLRHDKDVLELNEKMCKTREERYADVIRYFVKKYDDENMMKCLVNNGLLEEDLGHLFKI